MDQSYETYTQPYLPFKSFIEVKGVKDFRQALIDVRDNPSPGLKHFLEGLDSIKRVTRKDLETRLD